MAATPSIDLSGWVSEQPDCGVSFAMCGLFHVLACSSESVRVDADRAVAIACRAREVALWQAGWCGQSNVGWMPAARQSGQAAFREHVIEHSRPGHDHSLDVIYPDRCDAHRIM